MTVKLMFCPTCGIHTNHRQGKSGLWYCWCSTPVVDADAPTEAERDADAQWLGEESV